METDAEGYTRDNEQLNKRLYEKYFLRQRAKEGRICLSLMSVADMGIREVLCTSKSDSDYIENMKTGDKFDNWV